MAQAAENIKFEDALKRLDSIAAELSGEGLSLDEALALYEEGVSLVRHCNALLEATERRIKILNISDEGVPTETDMEL